ncbi:MAG: hypothetical protein H7123_07575 [Thermoleophilia bacterium]|nr:hypothetical protein [Thermoleophilia bacterium]
MAIASSNDSAKPVITPFRARITRQGEQLERQLLDDAARKLGTAIAGPPATDLLVTTSLLRQGATVRGHDGTTWTVLNDAGTGMIRLGRQTASGLVIDTVHGADLLRDNQHLINGSRIEIPAGTDLPAGSFHIDGKPNEPAVSMSDGMPRTPPPITLVRDTKPTAGTVAKVETITTDLNHILALKPTLATISVAGPKDIFDAATLVSLTSPRAIAVDGSLALDRTQWLAGARVSATPTAGDPLARSVMRAVTETQDWLLRRHGVNVIDEGGPVLTIMNSLGDQLNASMVSSYNVLGVGSLSDSVGTHLNRVLHPSGYSVHDTLQSERSISRDLPEVLAHEVGHQVTDQAWGVADLPTGYTKASMDARLPMLESGISREAFSDLIMAARTGKSRVAGRNLNALRQGVGDYQQLRATFARNPRALDVHDGTQLITQPISSFAKTYGWDLAGELTIATTRNIGDQILRGDLRVESLTAIAEAFRNTTAMRFGHDSPQFLDIAKAFARVKL